MLIMVHVFFVFFFSHGLLYHIDSPSAPEKKKKDVMTRNPFLETSSRSNLHDNV